MEPEEISLGIFKTETIRFTLIDADKLTKFLGITLQSNAKTEDWTDNAKSMLDQILKSSRETYVDSPTSLL